MKRLEVFLLPLDGISVYLFIWDASPSQVTPLQFVRFPQQFAGTHLYTWVERGTVRVKCLAQEQSSNPDRTANSGVERTNHKATLPRSSGGQDLQMLNFAKGSSPTSPQYECSLAPEGCHSDKDCHCKMVAWCSC